MLRICDCYTTLERQEIGECLVVLVAFASSTAQSISARATFSHVEGMRAQPSPLPHVVRQRRWLQGEGMLLAPLFQP